MNKFTLVLQLSLLTMLYGCKTTSLTPAETDFDVGVEHPDMVRAVVAYAAIGSGWEIVEPIEDGFRLSYSAGRHMLTCDVICKSGRCAITVVRATSGLKFDISPRVLHKRGVGWVWNLRHAIMNVANEAKHPYEVPPCALSVASGVDLKTVIMSVCKSRGMTIDDSKPNMLMVTKGSGIERCQLKIAYEKMLFSIVHVRPPESKTNGFQYDFLVRAINRDIIRFADPVLAEMERRTEMEHADRQRMYQQLDRLADAVYAVKYSIREATTKFEHVERNR